MLHQKMVWRLLFVAGTVLLSVVTLADIASAELLQLDSSSFTYKYEMDSETGLTFGGTAGTHSASGGIETIATTTLAGGRWMNWIPASGITKTTGMTVEARIQVLTQVAGGSYGGSVNLNLLDSAGTQDNLMLGTSVTAFQTSSSTFQSLGTNSNGDTYHVFRMVQLPGLTTVNVWRDGVLLSNTLNGYSVSGRSLNIGDASSGIGGSMNIDYVRFTSGAYAPVPEPATMTLLATGLIGLLAYAWRKRKQTSVVPEATEIERISPANAAERDGQPGRV